MVTRQALRIEGFFFILYYYLADMFKKKKKEVFRHVFNRQEFMRAITELNVYANPLQKLVLFYLSSYYIFVIKRTNVYEL